MRKYMQRHEQWLRQLLETAPADTNWHEVAKFHAMQIAFMQHERLIHLLVTLAFAGFFLLSVGFFVMLPSMQSGILSILFMGLLVAYIFHYCVLENGVQRWYGLANRLKQRCEPGAFLDVDKY